MDFTITLIIVIVTSLVSIGGFSNVGELLEPRKGLITNSVRRKKEDCTEFGILQIPSFLLGSSIVIIYDPLPGKV